MTSSPNKLLHQQWWNPVTEKWAGNGRTNIWPDIWVFLQNLEHLHLAHLSNKPKIINYLRYVEDILLLFNSNHTNIQNILDNFDAIHPNLKFMAETETNNKINYLDVTIHKISMKWKISIYRKSTFTDTIIPYNSNQPASPTQIRCCKVSLQQTEHIQLARERVQGRRKHYPKHHV